MDTTNSLASPKHGSWRIGFCLHTTNTHMYIPKFLRTAAIASVAIAAICTQSNASLVTYTQTMSGFTRNSDVVSGTFNTALGSGYTHLSFANSSNTDGTSYSPDVIFSTKTGVFGGSNTNLVNADNEVGPYGTWDGTLNIDFRSSFVSTVGFGLVDFNSRVESIRLYGAGNALIGTFNNQLSDEFSLWGVNATAGEQIYRIELDGNFFAIQDIEFSAKKSSVPDAASTLISLALGLICLGAARSRR